MKKPRLALLIMTLAWTSGACLKKKKTNTAAATAGADTLAPTYTLKGTVSGLLPGASLTFNLNKSESLTLTEDGNFTFAAVLKEGDSYAVAIDSLDGQWVDSFLNECSVTNGSGTAKEGLSDVAIDCKKILVFYANSGTSGERGLWRTDGTEAGTTFLHEVNSAASAWPGYNTFVSHTVQNQLFFLAKGSDTGTQLWRTDGTRDGTSIFYNSGNVVSANTNLSFVKLDSQFFYPFNDGTHGLELWKTDGSASGTGLVKDIGSNGGGPTNLTVANDRLYFNIDDAAHGTELWTSDGTDAGTVLVKDVVAGTDSSYPGKVVGMGDSAYFIEFSSPYQIKRLWKTDGTEAGTTVIKEIDDGAPSGTTGTSLAVLGNTLLFPADDGVNGLEMWKSDGTPAGTVMLKDIAAGATASNPGPVTIMGGFAYFTAKTATHGTELWKTDGTEAGTVLVKDIYEGATDSFPGIKVVAGDKLFITATDAAHGSELWVSDGTSEGTVLLKDINSSGGASHTIFAYDGTHVYFRATSLEHGSELWKSDGTTAGTVMVKDINPGSTGSNG